MSIPKGIERWREALVNEVKPNSATQNRFAKRQQPRLKARWPDLTGASAPKIGHLADSMPEVEVEEYDLKLSDHTLSLSCKESNIIQKTS